MNSISNEVLSFWDVTLLPFLFFFIFIFANNFQKRNEPLNPAYRYFTAGLFFKLCSGLILLLIYIYYYGGGDTTEYFKSSRMLADLIYKNPKVGFSILAGNTSLANFSYFDLSTGYPTYYSTPETYTFVRFITPFVMLSFQKFFLLLIIVNLIFFIGIWKFYLMVCELYPVLYKQFALAVLFIPSVVFWSSGILKDTFTFSATLGIVYNIYMIFIKNRKRSINLLLLFLNSYIIIMLKPYIFVALLPSTLFWVFFTRIQNIKNKNIKFYITPFLLMFGISIAMLIFWSIQDKLGYYRSFDTIITKAQITQQDLIRPEEYGNNSFDIGKIDPSFWGVISKTPFAIIAGLFRPFIWESKNFLMLISGLENLFILLLFIYALIKTKFYKTFVMMFTDPVLLFSFSFSIIFSFAVGLSSANFGALVRYRIPATPFFLLFLIVLIAKINEHKNSTLPKV